MVRWTSNVGSFNTEGVEMLRSFPVPRSRKDIVLPRRAGESFQSFLPSSTIKWCPYDGRRIVAQQCSLVVDNGRNHRKIASGYGLALYLTRDHDWITIL